MSETKSALKALRAKGREAIGGAKADRRTKTMRSLRLILPLFAVMIVVALIAWSGDYDIPDMQLDNIEKTIEGGREISKNELLSPKFQSIDNAGRPYEITAEKALQDAADENIILLEDPVGVVELGEKKSLTIRGIDGVYVQSQQNLNLKGDVQLTHSDGYDMYTQELSLDMKNSRAENNVDVRVEGPVGTIDAKGLEADGESSLLIFKGPATLTLFDGGDALKGGFGSSL